MLYSEEVLDRRTGELVTVTKGDWITVTELAGLYRVGPRKARSVLRKMEFLGIEGSRDHTRHRIQAWAVERCYGRRNKAKAGAQIPFDVISPEGRAWIDARWSNALAEVEAASAGELAVTARTALADFQESRDRREMTVHEEVSWLTHHFPALPHSTMGSILDVTQQLVSRYVTQRETERRAKLARREASVPDLGKLCQRGLNFDREYGA